MLLPTGLALGLDSWPVSTGAIIKMSGRSMFLTIDSNVVFFEVVVGEELLPLRLGGVEIVVGSWPLVDWPKAVVSGEGVDLHDCNGAEHKPKWSAEWVLPFVEWFAEEQLLPESVTAENLETFLAAWAVA